MIEFGPFRYDPEARLLHRGDDEIALPMRVVAVLESFLKRPGQVVRKNDILASAWEGAFVGEDSLTQAVSQLRSALGDDPHRPTYIQTIPKRGYRLIAEVSAPLESSAPVPRPARDSDDAEAAPAVLPAAGPERREGIEKAPVFAPGETVSHYQLLDRIGAGAMGQVWRARDRELQRDIAIKVVPDELAGETAVIERFRREALMLAAVNHPNIATIHGVEQINGTRFIVMELLEGETLQERLEREALPIDEALEIAVQITRALEVAHDAGIVHRDLKPGNVMLGPGDHVKVVDFGLAKDTRAGRGGPGTDPTLLTASGLVVGTAAYMSPEQAAGKPIDQRSDIFSFGCVLFEMLTGVRPFGGATASEIVAAILRDEPDWELLPRGTPFLLRALLRRCLQKDPDRRLHDVADARIEIEEARAFDAEIPDMAGSPAGNLPWSVAIASAAIALMAVATTVWFATRNPEGAVDSQTGLTRRFSIVLPDDAPMAPPGSFIKGVYRALFTLSPDANTLVYVAWREGSRHELWRHDMITGVFEPIPDTSGAYAPFFDPTGEQVGFFADGSLKTIDLRGSRSRVLAPVVAGRGGAWGVDGFIYYTPNQMTGVHRVPALGGTVEQITTTRILGTHAWPALVRGRGPLRFNASWSDWRVQRLALDGSAEPEGLLARGGHSMYADSGHLVWSVGGVLVASPVDADGRPVLETPVPVVDDVMASGLFADLARSTLVYVRGPELNITSLVWVSSDGAREPVGLPAARYGDFRISPDGKLLAYSLQGMIWLLELDDPTLRPVLVGPGGWPEWHPSGEFLFFTRDEGVLFRVDMSDAEKEPVEVIGADIFPGGSWGGAVSDKGILFYEWGDATGFPDLHFVPFEDDGSTLRLDAIRPIVRTPGDDIFPNISPDGRWVTYQSDNSGANQIYVVDLTMRAGPRRVSTSGGEEPRWSPDGHSIVYQRGGELYSVAFSADPEIALGDPVPVGSGPFVDVAGWGWDIAPDGRFLVLENEVFDDPITELVVITGFLEALKRKVPSSR